MEFRTEQQHDRESVYAVNTAAFGREGEAKLVDVVREQVQPLVSLVAEDDGVVVGHVLFTPVDVSGHPELNVMALGPVAVVPDRQQSGIGTRLIRAGLEQCKALGCGAIVVLGHPDYYPRFGFVPASRCGLGNEFGVPDEVFMAMELESGYLDGVSGTVSYHEAFRSV